MIDSGDVVKLYRQHVNSGMARLAGLVGMATETRASGSLVYDENDRAYLDCGGYGVFIAGHCHPTIVSAVRAQLERHPLGTRSMLSRELASAASTLAAVAPGELRYVCFANSGAEASEIGVKIARLNGKSTLISMHGGFHGKTLGALSISGRPRYRIPFEPLLPGVEHVAFGSAELVDAAVARHGDACCVIVEPVQGEAGVIIPPHGYLRDVQAICRRHGAMLMLDEIQTGLGRLGTWWGADREGITPDVMLVGKGLSGGCVPVAAAVVTPRAFEALNRDPLLHTSTFAGSPLATSAARAAIEVIRDEDLVGRAESIGARLLGSIRTIIQESCPDLVVGVRGMGLLIGIEFAADHIAGDFILELIQLRIVVSTSLNAPRVVRFTPPAVLSEKEIDWLLGAIREAAVTIRSRHAPASRTGIERFRHSMLCVHNGRPA
ncbi:MAG: putative putrescine aminotransferase [Tardiphaga sp.]|uniref:aspartate aminotransferase family protein n=1 Tax=Tardiphaga sp. TaxID=1926292 RepID=UPI00262BB05A|nr:aminotransferase class III-fold pyridoxal phosphate-dependent enzyme [Tardiphaga sp.]MDB5502869.1 putative putrescine aminotransferase [Tardiphaga sp.]